MKMKLAIALSVLASPALAHPGHEAPIATHWVSDLSHLAVVVTLAALSIVVVGAAAARRHQKARRKQE